MKPGTLVGTFRGLLNDLLSLIGEEKFEAGNDPSEEFLFEFFLAMARKMSF